MIPKIIHYCWFGRKDKPKSVIKNIETWKRYNPDFIIKEWNEDNFNIGLFPYVSEAYQCGKYAYVSDVARVCALINEGGIYMDTDVECVRPFPDILLKNNSFLGFEDAEVLKIGSATVGSISGFTFWVNFLDLYKNKKFILENGGLDTQPNTTLITSILEKNGLVVNNIQQIVLGISIYPKDYFSPKSYKTGKIVVSGNTICIHKYAASWMSPTYRNLLKCWFFVRYHFPRFASCLSNLYRYSRRLFS